MSKLSAIKIALLGLISFLSATGSVGGFESPVNGNVDLSSNFCEYRPAHFHGGIDIRTGGNEGREILAPSDGYVWRIKYAYDGYGKGLYLKGNNGLSYVFGHLSRLSNRLERVVWDYQLQNQVYSFDNFYGPDSLPVRAGELVAYSGQSGIGAPHIHFEVRDADNKPLNPLTNGLELTDNIAPTIEFVGFVYQDDSSVFSNGDRRLNKKAYYDKSSGRYSLKSVVPVRGPFGLRIKAFDQIRRNGPDLNIYRAKLFIDDYLYYETEYEKYDFDETAMTDLCFDYFTAEEQDQYWQNLYIPPGKKFSGDKSSYKEGGVFAVDSYLDYGLHHARAELDDAAGHSAEVAFDFVMMPPGDLYKSLWVDDTTCYLEANRDNHYLDIKSVKLYGSSGHDSWEPLESSRLEKKLNGDYQFTVASGREAPKVVKVEAIGESGWDETVGYEILSRQTNVKYSLDYKLVDGGLLFNISTRRQIVQPPVLEISYDDGYIAKINTSPAGDGHYAAYYRNNQISTAITGVKLYEPGDINPAVNDDLQLFHLGRDSGGISRIVHDNVVVESNNGSVYSPTGFEVKTIKGKFPEARSRIGDVISIGPTTIPLAESINLTFNLPDPNETTLGVYRLSSKNEWLWLNHTKNKNGLSAKTRFLGEFAVIKDTEAPRVKNIYPPDGKTVFDSYPQISCLVSDKLSGIENHENIKVYLDGRWLIPEYDPELELLKTYPEQRIKDGRHELQIIVSDRVGNQRTVTSHFFVNTQ